MDNCPFVLGRYVENTVKLGVCYDSTRDEGQV